MLTAERGQPPNIDQRWVPAWFRGSTVYKMMMKNWYSNQHALALFRVIMKWRMRWGTSRLANKCHTGCTWWWMWPYVHSLEKRVPPSQAAPSICWLYWPLRSSPTRLGGGGSMYAWQSVTYLCSFILVSNFLLLSWCALSHSCKECDIQQIYSY